MPRRFEIARPGRTSGKKKDEKRPKTIKTEISGSSIRISMPAPEIKIIPRPDGKKTAAFDVDRHHFEDTR